jgi:hypothetical protein
MPEVEQPIDLRGVLAETAGEFRALHAAGAQRLADPDLESIGGRNVDERPLSLRGFRDRFPMEQ